MSGDNCFEILNKIFKAKNPESIKNIKGYSIKYGTIVDEKNNIIDEVLVSYFKAPKSYTTENMCEINTHGGVVVLRNILDLCLKNGADLAEPGEFTKRAFLNGRIDLLQAESVIDIIHAKSEREAKNSINQLEGHLSKKINNIKKKIMDVMVNVEVAIDYPEYDEGDATNEELLAMFSEVQSDLEQLEKSFDSGKIIKEGIKTAIIGRPNAGKSSLLNAILKEERAIVSDIEGTTRDIVEGKIALGGILLNIIDTAGIRETDNLVESIGVKKSLELIDNSDLILFVLNNNDILTDKELELLEKIKDKNYIIVINKCDLDNKLEISNEFKNIVKISALENKGIDELKELITKIYNLDKIELEDMSYLTNSRSIALLEQAYEILKEAEKNIELDIPVDMVEIDIKEAWNKLGEIIGETYQDELIDQLFSQFCLGK